MVDLAMLCGDGGRSARQYFGKEIDAPAGPVMRTPSMLADLQAAMLTAPEKLMEGGRLVDPHEEHLFLPGLYVRQVTNEKGSLVITMKHATEHPWFCLRGHLLVRNLETGELHEVHGGDRGVTQPGTQRAIYAVEETVFVTVHPNPDDCRDLAELERRFIVRQELPGGQTAGELYRGALAQQEGGRTPRFPPGVESRTGNPAAADPLLPEEIVP